MTRRWLAAVLLLPLALAVARAEEDVESEVGRAIRDAASYGGSFYHLTAPVAALGKRVVPELARILRDDALPDEHRAIAAAALGRIDAPEALEGLRAALAASDLPEDVRKVVEESAYLRGDRDAVDRRVATLATKHRDVPIAATGAALHLAETYAATGRFAIAAGIMRDLVRAEEGARPEAAKLHAYNEACYAALAGDRAGALEAVRLALASDRTDLDWIAKDLDLALLHGDETFRGLLAAARERRAGKAVAATEAPGPGDAEYAALRKKYDAAFEAMIAANNRYWGGYQAWLEKRGLSQDKVTTAAYEEENGPAPDDDTATWIPRFLAFHQAHPGTAAGRKARVSALTILSNHRRTAEFVDLFLAALSDAPSLEPLSRHVRTALYFADGERKAAVREAVANAVASHPEDAALPQVRVALAETLQDDVLRREAYAEIARLHPGTDAAEEAEGALHEMDHLREGMASPDWSAVDVHGRPWSLGALKGKVVLLDFWATWCGPCMGELPAIKALHAKHAANADFVLLGVSFDADGWALAELLEKERMAWPQVCGLLEFDEPLGKLFHVRGIPHTVLIDREGRIAKVDLRGEGLAAAVDALLPVPR